MQHGSVTKWQEMQIWFFFSENSAQQRSKVNSNNHHLQFENILQEVFLHFVQFPWN